MENDNTLDITEIKKQFFQTKLFWFSVLLVVSSIFICVSSEWFYKDIFLLLSSIFFIIVVIFKFMK